VIESMSKLEKALPRQTIYASSRFCAENLPVSALAKNRIALHCGSPGL
jgi:hypothetical protein